MAELTPEQQEQVEELFEQVLEIEPASRPSHLDSSGAAPAVREEVASLLAYHPAARERLDTAVVPPEAVVEAVDHVLSDVQLRPALDPVEVGPYRVIKKLGEGGMGSVYLAEQDKPLRRQVAVKLIKLGMDTRGVLARFDAERQALALMNDPSIARVLEAGVSADGRPYFVMEYVDGPPITDYCDQNCLDLVARLELFGSVCRAVNHAHQKGIIHRDIKPSNVLVCEEDGIAIPKIIDFGVAKATHQRLTERTLFTEHGVLIGTPEYMSPEQATIHNSDVDTRSDIYSLGVLLYELLVGALPIDTEALRRAGMEELQRLVREHDPPRPTTRLIHLRDQAVECARRRGTELPTLVRRIRGDLEWIVMKCLEKDPNRRYATIVELTDDLDRFRRHHPVVAGPPSTSYRVRKFVRRHRGLVAGTAVVLFVLAAGLVSTVTFAIGEARQRADAQAQADTNKAINDFLNEMLASVDPNKAKGRDAGILRDILTEAAANVGPEFSGNPIVEASVRRTIGRTLMHLGLYDEAAPHLEQALELEQSLQRDSLANLAESTHLLGSLRDYQGRYDEGEDLLRRAIALRRDDSAQDRAALGVSLNKLAGVLLHRGRLEDAQDCVDESLQIHEALYGRDAPEAATPLNLLAVCKMRLGQHEEAESLFRECLTITSESLDDFGCLVTMHNLALTLKELGRYDESEEYYLRARKGYDRVVGREHPANLAAGNALAGLLELQGRHAESECLHREILATRRRTLGDRHPKVVSSLSGLGSVLLAQKRFTESIAVFREAADLARECHGPTHPVLAISLGQLGFALRDSKDAANYAESERVMLEALGIFDLTLPENHPYTLNTLRGLEKLYAEDAMDNPVKLANVEARLDAAASE
ncbi:MAG: serine/threonine-protein kinase [Phycisphaerae bacterium]